MKSSTESSALALKNREKKVRVKVRFRRNYETLRWLTYVRKKYKVKSQTAIVMILPAGDSRVTAETWQHQHASWELMQNMFSASVRFQ